MAALSLQDLQTDILPVTLEIAIEAYNLHEPFHQDAADRQIIACARTHGLTLLSADKRSLVKRIMCEDFAEEIYDR